MRLPIGHTFVPLYFSPWLGELTTPFPDSWVTEGSYQIIIWLEDKGVEERGRWLF